MGERQAKEDTAMGRFLSLVLRHRPDAAGIRLDEHGWAVVEELLEGVRKTGRRIDREMLNRIVAENLKRRYSFDESGTRIRANQGHSISVDVDLKAAAPPPVLYHGTAKAFLESIREKGVQRGSRLYVHLSKDEETAAAVGKRHGKPVVLVIDAKGMVDEGHLFFCSKNGVWLTESVPWNRVIEVHG